MQKVLSPVVSADGSIFTSKRKFQRFNLTTPDVLVITDEDDTRLPWLGGKENYRLKFNDLYLANNRDAFNHLAPRTFFVGATGLDFKSLQWIQERTKILNGFPPTDIEITDNGLELRVNENGSSPELWFNPANEISPNAEYELYIKKETGYERNIFFEALTNKLKEFGFTKVTDLSSAPSITLPNCEVYKKEGELPSHIVFSSGESAIYFLGGERDKDYKEFYSKLANEISKEYSRLTDKKKNIKFEISGHGNYVYIFFSPDNGIEVTKETAFNLALELLPENLRSNFRIAIACGDSKNDNHLKPQTLEIDGKSSPRYSIVTGKKLTGEDWLSSHPRLFWQKEESGNIGPSLLEIVSNNNSPLLILGTYVDLSPTSLV